MPVLEEARLHAAGELALGEPVERLRRHPRRHLVREPPGLAQRGDLAGAACARAAPATMPGVEVDLQAGRAGPHEEGGARGQRGLHEQAPHAGEDRARAPAPGPASSLHATGSASRPAGLREQHQRDEQAERPAAGIEQPGRALEAQQLEAGQVAQVDRGVDPERVGVRLGEPLPARPRCAPWSASMPDMVADDESGRGARSGWVHASRRRRSDPHAPARARGHAHPGPRSLAGEGVLRRPARARARRGAAGRAALPPGGRRVRAVRVRRGGVRRPHADGLRRRRHRGGRGRPPAAAGSSSRTSTCPGWRSATGSPRCPATTRARAGRARGVVPGLRREPDGARAGRCAERGRRSAGAEADEARVGRRRGAGPSGSSVRARAGERGRGGRAGGELGVHARPSARSSRRREPGRRSPTTVAVPSARRAAVRPISSSPGRDVGEAGLAAGEDEACAARCRARSRSCTVSGPSASMSEENSGLSARKRPWVARCTQPAPSSAAATAATDAVGAGEAQGGRIAVAQRGDLRHRVRQAGPGDEHGARQRPPRSPPARARLRLRAPPQPRGRRDGERRRAAQEGSAGQGSAWSAPVGHEHELALADLRPASGASSGGVEPGGGAGERARAAAPPPDAAREPAEREAQRLRVGARVPHGAERVQPRAAAGERDGVQPVPAGDELHERAVAERAAQRGEVGGAAAPGGAARRSRRRRRRACRARRRTRVLERGLARAQRLRRAPREHRLVDRRPPRPAARRGPRRGARPPAAGRPAAAGTPRASAPRRRAPAPASARSSASAHAEQRDAPRRAPRRAPAARRTRASRGGASAARRPASTRRAAARASPRAARASASACHARVRSSAGPRPARGGGRAEHARGVVGPAALERDLPLDHAARRAPRPPTRRPRAPRRSGAASAGVARPASRLARSAA